MNEAFVVKTTHLAKRFGSNEVIRDCCMCVRPGSVYGFLGANGSGKTTVFKLLTGLLTPTAGTALVCGHDVERERGAVLRQVGSLIEVPTFYEHLSAADNLALHLEYMGTSGAPEEALERVGLFGTGAKPVSAFSLGMRQRLGIARALVHRPRLLILDEPINGLDPMGIQEMRGLFQSLVSEGMTILLSSHILSEIEQVCDTIGVLSGGRIVREVELQTVCRECPGGLEEYFFSIMNGGERVC